MNIAAAADRKQLEESMRNHVATLRKMPAHWIDRRGTYHAKINDLLDLWEMVADE